MEQKQELIDFSAYREERAAVTSSFFPFEHQLTASAHQGTLKHP